MKVSKRVYWVLILSIGIVGCSKFNTNNVEQNSEVKNSEIKEVEVETILDSVKVSYIEDNILSYNTTLEFEYDKDVVFQNNYSDMEGIYSYYFLILLAT